MRKLFFKNKKEQLVLIGFVAFVMVFFSLAKFDLGSLPWPGHAYANLILDFNDGRPRMFNGPINDKMTVLLALYSSTRAVGLDLRYAIDQTGDTQLGSIDGASNRTVGKSWHFSINDQPLATKDINRVMIKRGDLIKAKFE